MPLDSRFKLDLVVGEWELYVLDSKVRNPPTAIRNAQTGISVYFDGVKNNRTKALKQLRRQVFKPRLLSPVLYSRSFLRSALPTLSNGCCMRRAELHPQLR